MIQFERFQLPNGLKVIFHPDLTTPMAVVNVLYDVGARDEEETKNGQVQIAVDPLSVLPIGTTIPQVVYGKKL